MRLRSRFRDSFVATRGKPPFFMARPLLNGFSSSSSFSSPLVALVFSAFFSSLSSAPQTLFFKFRAAQ
jgi:hypothetical protein